MTSANIHLRRARVLAKLLDSQWSILGIRFGLDPLLDIFPGLSSLIPTAMSFYLFYVALLLRVPGSVLLRMIVNIFIDYIIGIIPFFGILGDIFFRSNLMNIALLEKYNQRIQDDQIITA